MKHYILCGTEAVDAFYRGEYERVKYLVKNHSAQIVEFDFNVLELLQFNYLEEKLFELDGWLKIKLLLEFEYKLIM
jgi:hypothetical protein